MSFVLALTEEQLEALAARVAPLVAAHLAEIGGNGTDSSPWLTVEEAAALLRCDPQRVYEMRSSDRLTAYKEGGRAVVSRGEVESLIVKPT